MDLHGLRLFLHLADTLHFYKTSQACNISAPGLTRVIKRLEDEVGEQLFERNNRSVSLTTAGVLLQKYARDILISWQTFQNAKTARRGEVCGDLTLYCSVTASYLYLKQLLSDYRQTYPGVQIHLRTGEAEAAIKQVSNGSADIAIAARPDRLSARIEFKGFAKTPLVFIAGKELRYRAIADTPFVVPAQGPSRARLDQWFIKKKISPPIYAEVSGNEAIIAMVSLGFGISTVPSLVLDQSPFKNDIKILPLSPRLRDYEVGYCCLYRKNQKAAVKAFWQMIPDRI